MERHIDYRSAVELFGLEDGYTSSELMGAYQRLMRANHPDFSTGPNDMMARTSSAMRINDAHHVLALHLSETSSHASDDDDSEHEASDGCAPDDVPSEPSADDDVDDASDDAENSAHAVMMPPSFLYGKTFSWVVRIAVVVILFYMAVRCSETGDQMAPGMWNMLGMAELFLGVVSRIVVKLILMLYYLVPNVLVPFLSTVSDGVSFIASSTRRHK